MSTARPTAPPRNKSPRRLSLRPQAPRITRLNLAVREKRSIGGATPGIDAVAKVQVKIDPIETSSHLSDEVVAKSDQCRASPLHDLLFESPALGFRVKHDRQWYMTAERREAITFRRVDGSDLVAQCTLTALPPKSAGRQTSLEQFQKDIIFSLGKNFGELVSSRQFQNAAGLYCYEVVARGLVEELPRMALLFARPRKRQPRVRRCHDRKAARRVANADRD
jgi:hypothetical protein